MNSQRPGQITSEVEVTDISGHGIWMLVRGEEHFLPFEEFPWFRQASIEAVLNVVEPSPNHFYWPDLDIDLGLESIRNPARFPLKFKHPD